MSDFSFHGSDDNSSISTGSLHSIEVEPFFDYFDPIYKTPFYDACVNDDVEKAKEILQNGLLNVNRTDNKGDTFLHTAVSRNSYNIVKLLLAVDNIEINSRNFEGDTPVHLVSNPQILDLLLSAGCELEIKNNDGCTPILTIFHNCVNQIILRELVFRFIENGANIHVDNGLHTLMHYIFRYVDVCERQEELIAMVLYYGGDVNYKVTPSEPSPFMFALQIVVSSNIIDLMLPYVTDFNEVSVTGEPILFYVIQGRYSHVMELITNYVDCSYASETTSCLFLSLHYEDLSIFDYIWDHCNLKNVFQKHISFLYNYLLFEPNLPRQFFLKYLYRILSAEFAPDQLQGNPYILDLLVKAFRQYQIEREVRVQIIYLFLAASGTIQFTNIYSVFVKFGFNEEFEAFLNTTVELDVYSDRDPILRCIFFPEKSNCMCKPGVVRSLRVLARDVYRMTLRRPKNGIYFQYYNDVQKLDVPQIIKDIICFKKVL